MRCAASPATKGRNCQKRLADAGAPAAVDAVGEIGGDAPCFEDEARHPVSQGEGVLGLAASRRTGAFGEDPDAGHDGDPSLPAAR